MIKEFLNNFDVTAHLELWLLSTFLLALFIAYRSYGPIMYIAIKKHLMDKPDDRSVHTNSTPTLGGVGIYISLVLVICLAGVVLNSKSLLVLAGGLNILFFLGLKDDLLVLSARKKFLGQLIASFLFVTITDIRIRGFSNIFSVEVLPYWVSIGFTVFVFILIINAYNLIDGIDGLAGSIALLASLVFGWLFYRVNYIGSATLTAALAGALLPFLRLNASKKNKIFMGDTGSLIVGFMLAVFAVSYISYVQSNTPIGAKDSSPLIALSILFFPLMDTLRIFFVRIFIYKTSPFLADKNHIHHRLLDLGY
ncbi:MraY family glycosyltransferase [Algibacter sp.]|uniref:MraY family glycosyltransferase n=1 Tax=Algibacter sp. TaxID=1872428 RepID=UPI003C73DA34